MTYEEWIDQFRIKHKEWIDAMGSIQGLSKLAASQMAKKFTELEVVRGWVIGHIADVESGEIFEAHCQHWWCIKPDGTIIDPTPYQFRHYANICYQQSDQK